MESTFRPDIEGLRGIAVLLVVLCHAGVMGFSGGFIGVDIFFVISGYLITGLLIRELETTQAIDLFRFYARRVRRLLPAFLVMSLVTALLLKFAAPAMSNKLQSLSETFAALWSSNIYFATANFGYFDTSVRESLFLHTWSLGVEEQFYLIWPLLLLFVWRVVRTRKPQLEIRVIAGIAFASFVLCVVGSWAWPVGSYYLMPFRLWELALGGLCTRVPVVVSDKIPQVRLIGLLLLGSATVFVNEHVTYPGFLALLPVVGASFLVVPSRSQGRRDLGWKFLTSAPLTFVGRISYSWYLWHWPMLVLARHEGFGDANGLAFAVLGSFLISSASYWFVERTTRYRQIRYPRTLVALGLLGTGLAAVLPFAIHLENGSDSDFARAVRAQISFPAIYSIEGCDDWYLNDRLVPCRMSAGADAKHTAVFIGDSLGMHLFPAISQAFLASGWNFVVLTKSSCPIVDESIFYERIHRIYGECDRWKKSAVTFVQENHPDIVIVGFGSSYKFSNQQWFEGSRRIFQSLKEGSQQLLVLAPTPQLPFDGPECVINHGESILRGDVRSTCSVRLETARNDAVINQLRNAIGGLPGAAMLDVNDAICPEGICSALYNRHLVYRDEQHLNADFAASLEPVVAAKLNPYIARAADQNGMHHE